MASVWQYITTLYAPQHLKHILGSSSHCGWHLNIYIYICPSDHMEYIYTLRDCNLRQSLVGLRILVCSETMAHQNSWKKLREARSHSESSRLRKRPYSSPRPSSFRSNFSQSQYEYDGQGEAETSAQSSFKNKEVTFAHSAFRPV